MGQLFKVSPSPSYTTLNDGDDANDSDDDDDINKDGSNNMNHLPVTPKSFIDHVNLKCLLDECSERVL